MVFSVLKVVFFQLHAHLALVCELTLCFLGAFSDQILVFLEDPLVVSLLLEFYLVLPVKLVKFRFMLLTDF